ncbi:response regulator transcription factor [Paenibacillus aestuarii]|uniref:Response regulator n=1 Tax=Paenibacillus aestuarii TaxID=516965 RepID=A0ABW0K4S8_9BACL|nr:response regulator [Paenibacillus aestuarii]
MYRVLIVDDEPEIRQGLLLKVDWTELRLTIAGEAANGTEALAVLANEAIDIVITDMNMPVMNGVTFLEACQEQYPLLKVIVLTGYEDIHYAKAAVRHHARDYLLKPVSREELKTALLQVKKELDNQRSNQDQQAAIQWRLSQYYKEMKEHFIVQLVKDEFGEQERMVRERAKLFQLDSWEADRVRFLTAGLIERSGHAASLERSPEKLRMPFELMCREFAEASPVQPQVFRDANYPSLMHFIVKESESDPWKFADELRACVAEHLGFQPVVGMGQPVAVLEQWKEGFVSALLDWNLKEMELSGTVEQGTAGRSALAEESLKVIQRSLAKGEFLLFQELVRKELKDAFLESKARFVKLILQLYLLLDAMAYAARIPLEGADQLWLLPEYVRSLDTVEKAEHFLSRLASKISRSVEVEPEDSDSSVIQSAKRYIDENYMYDLNLTMLAERFNYNPTYFSELFKANVGKPFVQYMTDVRMAEASHLLQETSLNLWDIAELTGFSNASYFSAKFKKMYGVSPSEFRQKLPEKIISGLPKK